jgi:hypothetical protein
VLYCKLLFSVPDIAEINKYDVLQITESEWVSECLLFIDNSAIFQLYYGENKLIFNEMMMRSALY